MKPRLPEEAEIEADPQRYLQPVSIIALLLASGLVLFSLAARLTGGPQTVPLDTETPPITLGTTLCLLLSLVATAGRISAPQVRALRRIGALCAAVVLATGIFFFLKSLQRSSDESTLPAPDTVISLMCLSTSLLLARERPLRWRGVWLDHLFLGLALLPALLSITGVIFGTPVADSIFSRGSAHGMSLTAAICILLLALSLMTSQPYRGLTTLASSGTLAGYMARRLFLALFVFPPLIGALVSEGQRLGFYPAEYRPVLLTVGLSGIFFMMTWWTAKHLWVSEHLRNESQLRFKRLTDRLPDPIFIIRIHPEIEVEYVSPSIKELLGLDPADFRDNPGLFQELIYPRDFLNFQNAFFRPEKNTDKPVLLRWIRPGGDLVWTESRQVAVHDPGGRVVRVEGIIRNITPQKLIEEEREDLFRRLENEKTWLNRLVDLAPVAIVSASVKTGAAHLNRKALQLFGEKNHTLLASSGKPLPRDETPASRASRGEDVAGEELLVQTDSGKTTPVLVNTSAIRDPDGSIAGTLSIYEDISALKELDRLREEWSSVIAHDLRQPITSIQIQSELLLSRPADATLVSKLAGHILTSVRQLNRMTADLLDTSRIESHRLTLERKPTDLAELVRNIVTRMGLQPNDRKIRIEAERNLPEVSIDPGRFEQIIGNLLSNAVKYGFPGSDILVRVQRQDDRIEFEVTNEGKGIPEESLKNLFQRFGRASWAVQDGIQGIGLGLYITKGLVEAHGGKIEVRSDPGKHTTFRVTLPMEMPRAA